MTWLTAFHTLFAYRLQGYWIFFAANNDTRDERLNYVNESCISTSIFVFDLTQLMLPKYRFGYLEYSFKRCTSSTSNTIALS